MQALRSPYVSALFYAMVLLGSSATSTSAQGSSQLISPAEAKKVYYLLASAQGIGRSSFGHAYLRVSASDEASLDDEVVEFVADGQVSSFNDYLRAIGLDFFDSDGDFKRVAAVQSYAQVMGQMNFSAGRDLTSYELLITPRQRAAIVQALNHAVSQGSYGDYSFFSENCASATKEILAAGGVSLDKGISGVIPTAIPDLLSEAHLVGQVITDRNLAARRELLYQKYAPQAQALAPLHDELTSPDLSKRVLGFERLTKLTLVSPSPALSSFLDAFAFLEPRVVRSDLLQALQGQRNLSAAVLPRVEFRLHSTETEPARILGQYIELVNGGFWLVYSLHAGDEKAEARIPLPLLSEAGDGRLLWDATPVGIHASASIDGAEFILDGLSFIPSIARSNSTTWMIDTYVLADSLTIRPSKTDSDSWIPLINNDPSRPSCNAMVDLQKAILERTIFDRTSRALSQTESLKLVESVLNGKFVVIPGFQSARPWLASLDESSLRDVIYAHQKSHYEGWANGFQNYFSAKALDTSALLEIGRLARLGYPTPIFEQVGGSVAHSILVLDVVDEGARLRIVAYDPNQGFVRDMFHFDKSTQLSDFTVYPAAKLQALPIDFEKDAFDSQFMRADIAQLMTEISHSSGAHEMDPFEILSVY